jgi:hypothetical protein
MPWCGFVIPDRYQDQRRFGEGCEGLTSGGPRPLNLPLALTTKSWAKRSLKPHRNPTTQARYGPAAPARSTPWNEISPELRIENTRTTKVTAKKGFRMIAI